MKIWDELDVALNVGLLHQINKRTARPTPSHHYTITSSLPLPLEPLSVSIA